MQAMIGRELGNYVVESLLGEGGMGAVFRGTHRFLKTPVAIKVLHGTFAKNPSITERFFQEAKSAIEIGHPSIIRILDFGQSKEGELYLVMELLEGQSLKDAIASRGRFTEEDAARVGAEACDGLYAAHVKGIVHRDLKPDNLFVTHAGEVKILDFGIAKVTDSGAGTKTGSLMGTPQYMAPEQARDSKNVGPWTDIYAMGAILFAMLTGRPPFLGDSLPELLAHHFFDPPPPPSSLVPVSAEIEALILSCLAKKSEERPADMAEVRDALRARLGLPAVGKTFANIPRTSGQLGIVSSPPIANSNASTAPPMSDPGRTTLSGAASEVGKAAPPRRLALKIGLPTVLLAGGAMAALMGFPRRPPPSSAAPVAAEVESADKAKPAPAAKAQPAAAPEERKVTIQFMIIPNDANASVFVDGEKLDQPALTIPASQTRKISVKVEAAGYEPNVSELRPVSDLVVPISLVKVEAHKSKSASKPKSTPRVNRVDSL